MQLMTKRCFLSESMDRDDDEPFPTEKIFPHRTPRTERKAAAADDVALSTDEISNAAAGYHAALPPLSLLER